MGYGKAAGVGGALVGTGTVCFCGGIAVTSAITLPVLGLIAAYGAAGTAVGAGIGALFKFLSD